MKRFSRNEISFSRVIHALLRRAKGVFDGLAWFVLSNTSSLHQKKLMRFVNKHQGQRCFILGNGPSLAKMDLTPLEDEITFGLNRIYLLFDKIPFVPTYYVSVNELVLEQFASEIKELRMPKFINWNSRKHYRQNDLAANFLRLRLSLRDGFNTEIGGQFYSGGTVTYVTLQLAYIMGFSEVVLIGVDHSFVDKGIPNKAEVRNSMNDENHFHPDYFPKGSKWQLPDLRRSELAYTLAKQEFEKDGRKIVDATTDGKLTVFEKVKFEDLW